MLKKYTFTYKNSKFETEALNFIAAAGKANREFLDHLDSDPYPGAWIETTDTNSYNWVGGNFFD